MASAAASGGGKASARRRRRREQEKTADEVQKDLEAADQALGKPMQLALDVFQLWLDDEVVENKAEIKARVMEGIRENNAVPLYEQLCAELGWAKDEELVQAMQKEVDAKIAAMDAKIQDCQTNYGDAETFDAQKTKATFLMSIGDKAAAVEAFDAIETARVSGGLRTDIHMAKAVVGFIHGDTRLARSELDKAKALNEKGGDWDRRNRLMVYEGAFAMLARDFKAAAGLLLESIATYTCYEMFTYKRFILYAVLMSMHSLERTKLKAQVVDSPDVRQVIHEVPFLDELLSAFYETRYADYFEALVGMVGEMKKDKFLSQHTSFYFREMRVRAYAQFLEAYKTVTLSDMAAKFGVSTEFLDGELARFVAAGRLSARIDSVAGVVETRRQHPKRAQYAAVVRQGDVLKNKIQLLARMVAV